MNFLAGASDLYLQAKNAIYRSKRNLKTPVWEKEPVTDPQNTSIVFKGENVVESEGVLIATVQKGIMRSTDRGEHWEWVINEGGVGIAVERIGGWISCYRLQYRNQIQKNPHFTGSWKNMAND